MDVIKRWAAQHYISVLPDAVLTTQPVHLTRNGDSQIRSISNKQGGGKCDGLMINTDPLTGRPVPCVDHDGISDHVLRDLERNATEKGDGPSAFAATHALHRVLYV